jgi:hypothetical protein
MARFRLGRSQNDPLGTGLPSAGPHHEPTAINQRAALLLAFDTIGRGPRDIPIRLTRDEQERREAEQILAHYKAAAEAESRSGRLCGIEPAAASVGNIN